MNLYAYRRHMLSSLGRLSFVALAAGAGAARAQPAEPAPSAPVEAVAEPKAGAAHGAADGEAGPPKACAEDWKKRTYRAAKASIVRVEPIGMSVAQLLPLGGFVYPTGRHVVTHYQLAVGGRGAWVTLHDGRRLRARLSATDEENDLALFELEGDSNAPPLELSDRPAEAGDEVVSIQQFEDVTKDNETQLDAWLQGGHIANDGGRIKLRFDGGRSYMLGTTVFGCDGKVVALRSGSALTPARAIRGLLSPRAAEVRPGAWSAEHFRVGALAHFGDGRGYGGLDLGMSLVANDRWQLRFDLGATVSPDADAGRPGATRRRTFGRMQFETGLGYRFLLSDRFPIYFVPQVGVAARWDFKNETNTRYSSEDPACFASGQGPCELKATSDRDTTHRFGLLPTVGASVLIHALGVGYGYQIDTQDSRRSTHQVFVGLEF